MKVVFAGGIDWPARVLTNMGGTRRLYSYYYSREWDPEDMPSLKKTGLALPQKRQGRLKWGNTSHDKRRTLEVLRRARRESEDE